MFYFIFSFFSLFAYGQQNFTCAPHYDDLNIPHQETRSREEFYYCFGYHHGKDRAWQMDFFRRVGEGRNAEILGFSHLKSDLMMRLLDLPSLAERLWKEFSLENKKWIELYAAGVNEGFKIGKEAKEFRDLGFSPRRWKPEDSLLVLMLQSFDQTRKTFFRDYEEEKFKEKWGEKATDLFDEDNMPWENTILKDGEYLKRSDVHTTSIPSRKSVKLWAEFPTLFGLESGSNNWAVSAKKSKSGKAILANDPHLDLKTPMFWYWIHLKSPDVNVIGGSVPGVPVIASGTNGKVAWGLTNSYMNSADIFFINEVEDSDLREIRPFVFIKFWFFKIPFFFKTFEQLKTGHRILPLETKTDGKLVLRWTGFKLKAEDLYPMFDFNRARNVKEMDSYLAKIGVPSWNFTFADSKGEIGYRMIGKTYRHTKKIPYGIGVKTLQELEEDDFLKPSERPHVLNPSRQYVYSANNRHWPVDSKFYGGRGYNYSFRGYRIDEMLKGMHDIESFKNIQCDRTVVDAKFFIPKIRQNIEIKELDNWDLRAHDASSELPLYRRLMNLMTEKWEVNEYALYKLLGSLTIEQTKELEEMYKLAKKEIGGRTWSEMLRVNFPHMSKNDDWIFSPDLPGIGDSHSIDPGSANWNPERRIYEQYSGSSMRMIIELGETTSILLTLPGHNRNYVEWKNESPWKAWRNCEYTSVKF